MKKLLITILLLFAASIAYADSVLVEGFEYANHDGETPVGWTCDDNSWLCGYQEKDHNRIPHSGSWYAYTNADESWMFIPIYMGTQQQYRFSFWAISDGSYTVEFWAGTQANTDNMMQLLFTKTVSSGQYENFSEYIATINDSYDYLGIRAVGDADTFHLTIDDINIEQIVQYSFHTSPNESDTTMQAGQSIVFYCKLKSEGYETVTIYMSSVTEYFTDVHFYVNGEMTSQFPITQDETVTIRGTATLRPDIEPGTRCWFDVLFTIDCGCASAMYTYWATVITNGIDENHEEIALYPNPSTGDVTFEGMGQITIYNTLGQLVLTKEIIEKESITLKSGIYFIKMDDQSVTKLVVK